MELEGQVAIVTGAGRGIGRATALELARMGAPDESVSVDEFLLVVKTHTLSAYDYLCK